MEIDILHLDDDALYHEQLAKILNGSHPDATFRVRYASDGVSYRRAVTERAPDCVILDVNLGGSETGKDMARWTRREFPNVVILMCSELQEFPQVADAMRSGADDYVFKGGDETEIRLRILGTVKHRKQPEASASSAGVGKTMMAIADRLRRIADSAVISVHVHGETGTGKEKVADTLQAVLPKGTPFVKINCGAIAPSVLESELFGYVKGAFTGAIKDKLGFLESANGGWVFLDEVAMLSPSAQVGLLRVIENQAIRRVGDTQERPIQLRVLSATNESLDEKVESGDFRADLWQRLRETVIELQPLRRRMEEFPVLVDYFLQAMRGGPYRISESARDLLSKYDWREGNIRELRNCLRAMTELSVDGLLTPLSLPKSFWQRAEDQDGQSEADVQSEAVSARGSSELRLTWNGSRPGFERLQQMLLAELIRQTFLDRGTLSLRQLSAAVGVPKSTLATRMRQLVDDGVLSSEEACRALQQKVGQSDADA